jgi:hypothetical protein
VVANQIVDTGWVFSHGVGSANYRKDTIRGC